MIETNIFETWLDAEAERVAQKLAANEHLSPDDKLTVVLKGLTNHVAHLDIDLRGEIAAVRTELKSEIAAVRTELKGEIAAVRTELKGEIAAVRTELKGEIVAVQDELKEVRTDIKEIRKEILDIHKALNNQVWKIVGALSLIGMGFGVVRYFLKI